MCKVSSKWNAHLRALRPGYVIPVTFAALSFGISSMLCACESSKPGLPSIPQGTYSLPLIREVVEWHDYPGRLQSPKIANLSARVDGIVEKAQFVEGSLVTAGDVLFLIDERPFRAEYLSKVADTTYARAQLAQAQAHFTRYEALKGTRAISAQDFDNALAEFRQAKAKVAVAEAAEAVAKLHLDWTSVEAPISGRISRKYVTEGNLVSGGDGDSTQLATITSVDPMYCYVNVPEREFLQFQSLASERKREGAEFLLPCAVKVENELSYKREGVIDFVGSRVDPATGTVELRCAIRNQDGILPSGLFARMRIPGSGAYTATLIPDVAVNTDQNSRYVLVIDSDNAITRHQVELGALFGPFRAITKGVDQKDRVLVNGLQGLRPGTKVTPSELPTSDEQISALNSAVAATLQKASSVEPGPTT